MNTAFTARELDRISKMDWEDSTPLEAIRGQFGLSEKEIIELMRSLLEESSFKLWRKQVNSGVSQKHIKKSNPEITHFKCSRQKAISSNRISKR